MTEMAEKPTEAEEIIAALERIGLNALDNVQAAHKSATEAGKDPKRNQYYRRAQSELDGITEALGHAQWVHKYYAAGGADIGTYPSSHDALMHLHALKKKRDGG